MNHEAVYKTHSNVATIRNDVAYDENDNVVELNETAIQTYIDANAYKAKRAAEYPSYADQLDTIFHEGLDAWKATIQAVKDKYPKD